RWASSPLMPIPKPMVKVVPMAPKSPHPRGGGSHGGDRPGLLGILAGARLDELGKDNPADAFKDARVGNAPLPEIGRKEDLRPRIESIDVRTDGARETSYAAKSDARVEKIELDDPPASLPDPEVLQRYISARRSALATCYEHELKYNRALRGKLVVRLTVATDGRARDIEIAEDSIGSAALASCITSTVRRWIFPLRSESDFPLQF